MRLVGDCLLFPIIVALGISLTVGAGAEIIVLVGFVYEEKGKNDEARKVHGLINMNHTGQVLVHLEPLAQVCLQRREIPTLQWTAVRKRSFSHVEDKDFEGRVKGTSFKENKMLN